ncbi:MAG: cytochrome c-type biogenesis protein [Gaiellaceae bacterium]
MKRIALSVAVLALAAPALASETRPTLVELESEVICPTCLTPLDQSDAPIARRMKSFIAARIAAGDTKSEIKDSLVAQFGQQVLAAPPKEGFNLLAWLLPLVGIVLAAGVLSLLVWSWSRGREPAPAAEADPSRNGHRSLEPELERRLDEELARFDG